MSIQTPEPISGRLLDMDQTAAFLGIAKATLYTMVSQRRVPYIKVGSLTKFDKAHLDRWIEKHTVKPMG